jgi:phage repressor protein C with HTH and peptisase S24 domain
MDSHQRVWNTIDAIAWKAGLTPCGLAKAAGMDATVFNRSKRVDPRGRPRWPSVETIQKVLDATGTTWFAFARLVEEGAPTVPHSD